MARFTVGLTTAVVASLALTGACSSSKSSTSSRPSTSASSSTSVSAAATTTTSGAPGAVAKLTSTAFADNAPIPKKYACTRQGGSNASPPLAWSGFPTSGATLVLVVHDPDAPIPGGFTHLVTTMDAGTTSVADGANAGDGPMRAWQGPCPPSGTHHYRFTLYAFGSDVKLPSPLDKKGVDAIASRARASAELTGLFTAGS